VNPPFEILEHTADVGLRAFGKTLAELFANAARGMIALALETERGVPSQEAVQPEQTRLLSANGEDREELLVHFLSEILYAVDAEGWQFREFGIELIGSNAIEAKGRGTQEELSENNRVAVKAVTYHQVSITQTAGGWEAVVYFDI